MIATGNKLVNEKRCIGAATETDDQNARPFVDYRIVRRRRDGETETASSSSTVTTEALETWAAVAAGRAWRVSLGNVCATRRIVDLGTISRLAGVSIRRRLGGGGAASSEAFSTTRTVTSASGGAPVWLGKRVETK